MFINNGYQPMDEAWFKYIDETYHIENDYLHYLDILKFNIMPDYILEMVNNMIKKDMRDLICIK